MRYVCYIYLQRVAKHLEYGVIMYVVHEQSIAELKNNIILGSISIYRSLPNLYPLSYKTVVRK